MRLFKRIASRLLLTALAFAFLASPASGYIQGDMNDDNDVTLADAVLIMKFLAKMGVPPSLQKEVGVGDDQKIGLDDLVYVLQVVSSFRNQNSSPTASFSLWVDSEDDPLRVNFDASGSSDPEGTIAEYLWAFGDGGTGSGKVVSHTYIESGRYECKLTVVDKGGARGVLTKSIEVIGQADVPPDPEEVAPPVDPTVATTLAAAAEFLYTGTDPIQTGVEEGSIEARRAGVIRGRVLTRHGSPLFGVAITVIDHPEYGRTLSRLDGMFDMAVNGGGYLTVNYQKTGYLPAQRQVDVPWQDSLRLPDVVLVTLDTNVTRIDLTSTEPFQVARGSVVDDQDGARQATLLIPQGTQAQVVLTDGSSRPVSSLNIRATEYTVGANGPQSMPAELPPQVAYTYCVELSADEGVAKIGGKDVLFSQPVPLYVNNFLEFPVGESVPLGYYDNTRGTWVPYRSGRVIKILSIAGGLASVDVDGDGTADTGEDLLSLGITDAERRTLAGLYTEGATLWRMQLSHLSTWDANWAFAPPPDAAFPNQPEPERYDPEDDPCEEAGSLIDCQNQTLGESIEIAGTPFSLNYRSSRLPGHKAAYTLKIPLSGPSVPGSLSRIELKIEVAGRQFTYQVGGLANQSYTFVWDRKDAYGRLLQGQQPVTVRVGYAYRGVYQRTDVFGYNGGGLISGSRTRQEVTFWQVWKTRLSSWDARSQGLGGWTLSVHHAYDPGGCVLYLGSGERRSTMALGTINTIAGVGIWGGVWGFTGDGGPATEAVLKTPKGVALRADGGLYIADRMQHRIRLVQPNGIIITAAGTGGAGFSGDGGLATAARLSNPYDVALGPDGSLYIVDSGNYRIRRVGPDGIITTVAGTGVYGYSGDGGPAIEAQIQTNHVAAGADGSLYINNYAGGHQSARIRRVGPDGIITTVAGTGGAGFSGDGGPAIRAQMSTVTGLAVGPDGGLYISDYSNHRIRRVGPDGIITTVAGMLGSGFSGDGGLATEALLRLPSGVTVSPDGTLYIVDLGNYRLRRVGPDGIISTVAGTGVPGYSGDGGPATRADIGPSGGIAVGPDSTLYFSQSTAERVRSVLAPTLPAYSGSDMFISSEDGREVYAFGETGKHYKIIASLTESTHYQFGYDSEGLLSTITDRDGKVTTIERATDGTPTAIVAPYGQQTVLSVNSDGYLSSVSNPAGNVTQFTYTEDGLLTTMIDPEGSIYQFTYDTSGLLTKHEDPTGGSQALVRSAWPKAYEVSLTTAENRATTYRVESLSTGDKLLLNTFADGNENSAVRKTDGSTEVTLADETLVVEALGPDPRFGMQAPIPKSVSITTPAKLSVNLTMNRTASPSTLAETVSVNGRAFVSSYDIESRTLTDTTPQGRQSTTRIDSLGRPVEYQSAGLFSDRFAYDAAGRLITMKSGNEGDERTTSLAYGPEGLLQAITDPLSRTFGLDHDPAGRLTRVTLPDLREILLTRDARGSVTAVTPPGRPAHAFEYNAVGLMTRYVPPVVSAETEATHYSFNQDRQLTQILQPGNRAIDFDYDSGGRLISLEFSRGTITYDYFPATGQLRSMAAPGGVDLHYGYDGRLLRSESWSGPVAGSVDFDYDHGFRLINLKINNAHTVSFQYDQDNLLTRAGDLTLSYDHQHGLLTGTTLADVADTWSYNGFGEPDSHTVSYQGSPVFDSLFAYSKVGQVMEKTETIAGKTDVYTYTYDQTGRLTGAEKNGLVSAAYTYDSNSNRLSGPGAGTSYVYDHQDRLLTRSSSLGTQSYSYRAHGELQSKVIGNKTTTYEYDELGNLTSVSLPDGTAVQYLVDGRNRRIGRKIDGALVQGFLYADDLKPVAELDSSSNMVSLFVYGSSFSTPDYMVKGGVTYRIITDYLGSPRLIINTATGVIIHEMDYDEFGNVVKDTNPGFQPFGFAGGLYDPLTGLVRFGARDYDAEAGRWMAKDPLIFDSWISTNTYEYVMNDPVNLIDPEGKQPSGNISPQAEKLLNWQNEIAKPMMQRQFSTSPGGYATEWYFRLAEYAIMICTGTVRPKPDPSLLKQAPKGWRETRELLKYELEREAKNVATQLPSPAGLAKPNLPVPVRLGGKVYP